MSLPFTLNNTASNSAFSMVTKSAQEKVLSCNRSLCSCSLHPQEKMEKAAYVMAQLCHQLIQSDNQQACKLSVSHRMPACIQPYSRYLQKISLGCRDVVLLVTQSAEFGNSNWKMSLENCFQTKHGPC